MKALLINGYCQIKPVSEAAQQLSAMPLPPLGKGMGAGSMTAQLCQTWAKGLAARNYQVISTVVADGFDVSKEQDKLFESDVVVVQTPLYWYERPWQLKKYFDEVFETGVVTVPGAGKYGSGGALKGRRAVISVTMAAPNTVFDQEQFLEGVDPQRLLLPFISTMRFVGMEVVATIVNTQVFGNPFAGVLPDIETFEARIQEQVAAL